MTSSRIPGFHLLSAQKRLELLSLGQETEKNLKSGGIDLSVSDVMVENAIGVFGLPLGVATNFIVDGQEHLVPMAIEEPSVIAAASHAAKLARDGGGFKSEVTRSIMTGQIQVTGVKDTASARKSVEAKKEEIILKAHKAMPRHVARGGSVSDFLVREFPEQGWLVIHLGIDCLDAMGANLVNTVCESVAPLINDAASGQNGLKILTNLCDNRMAQSTCRIPIESLAHRGEPEAVASAVVQASEFAMVDPYRASTHNKGIFNGIDAVLIAAGNDWRGVSAGAHAFAARGGSYKPLSAWTQQEGSLVGKIEMPLAAATVGGALPVHPLARDCQRLMNVQSAKQLAAVVVSVGLASNLAALLALSTEGIQRGHMQLHARKVAHLEDLFGKEG